MHEPPVAFAVGENQGRYIFRVIGSYATVFALRSIFPMLALVFIAEGIGVDSRWIAWGLWVPTVLAFFAGLTQRRDLCSDPECETVLPEGVDRCPRCLGNIVGEIKNPKERLAAEERFVKSRRGSPE